MKKSSNDSNNSQHREATSEKQAPIFEGRITSKANNGNDKTHANRQSSSF